MSISPSRPPGRLRASLLCLVLLGSLFQAVPAVAAPASPFDVPAVRAWVSGATDPSAVSAALETYGHKVPTELAERLKHVDGGILRVMVAVSDRDAAVESFVSGTTTWVRWYYDSPRFYAGVTPDQFAKLLAASFVDFVEPDVPLTYFMSASTIDIHARSLAGDGTGVWSFDPAAGPRGALRSDIPGLSVEQATGKGVTVAVTDSGIDRTHRDFGGWDCGPGPYQPCDSRIVRAVTTEHLIGGPDPGDLAPTTEVASGHGAHVAGTIAGNGYYARDGGEDPATYGADGIPFGVAPQANLIMTKNGDTLWAGLSGFALEWQLENAEKYDIRVSSNSWGCLGGCSFNGNSTTAKLFRDMYNAGILTVFAAGNDGGGQDGAAFSGNAQSPYVLGVAAYNTDDHRLASFSSRGSDNTLPDPVAWTPASEPVNGERRPDVAAPGVDIWSARTLTGGAASGVPRANTTDVTGGGGCCIREYAIMDGTSMATPHVAGAAALAFSACPTATPLDVMRSIIATAEQDILKTTGSGTAEPFEVGYGGLEVRAAVDWLLARNCDSDAAGPDPEPTTDSTPTATPTDPTSPSPSPTESSSPEPLVTTSYYLHSGSRVQTADKLESTNTFDKEKPTQSEPALATDVPVAGNVNPAQVWDPSWVGTVEGTIRELEVDFWAKVPEEELQTSSVTWRITLWNGATEVVLPNTEIEGVNLTGPTRFTHTFSTMLSDPNNQESEVPLNITPAGTFAIQITPWFTVNGVGATVVYDSANFPSRFTAFTTGGTSTPDPSPSETPVQPTTVSFTSGTSGQHGDDATIAARLTESDGGAPIAGAELVFELVGEGGPVATWNATTDADGVATATRKLDHDAGAYNLTVHYAGEADTYEPSSGQSGFVIDPETTVTTIDVTGKGSKRSITATLAEDDGAPLDRMLVFYATNADGVRNEIHRAETRNGSVTFTAPQGYRGDSFDFEAVFEGERNYSGSSAHDQT